MQYLASEELQTILISLFKDKYVRMIYALTRLQITAVIHLIHNSKCNRLSKIAYEGKDCRKNSFLAIY